LKTVAAVSVSQPGTQSVVHAVFIPLTSEIQLRKAFESVGLIPKQVTHALKKLKKTKESDGFLIPIDQGQPRQ
jgi:hypothetical protein